MNNVSGISFDKATAVAYRTLTTDLTVSSTMLPGIYMVRVTVKKQEV